MSFTLDWSASDLDGGNALTDGGDSVNATVNTPAGTGEFVVQGNAPGDMPNGILSSNLVGTGAGQSNFVGVSFDDEVSNISFTLYDIDEGGSWDDLVSIEALDAFGDPVPVTITTLGGQIVTVGGVGDPDEGVYYINGEITDPAELGSVTVTIAGPVADLTITFTDGEDSIQGGYIGVGDLTFDLYVPPCFVRGTLIETDRGDIAVEDLLGGDMVRTLDNGFQPIRWIGSASVSAKGSLAPILFKAGAIGNTTDLMVSPWHRVMLQSWQVELLFGDTEMLAAAKTLVNDQTILRVEGDKVEYFHVLFDTHQIVFSNGAPTESFHPGEAASSAMSQKTRSEVFELFPELEKNTSSYGPTVRATLAANEVSLLNA